MLTGPAPTNIQMVSKCSLLSHAMGGSQEHLAQTCQRSSIQASSWSTTDIHVVTCSHGECLLFLGMASPFLFIQNIPSVPSCLTSFKNLLSQALVRPRHSRQMCFLYLCAPQSLPARLQPPPGKDPCPLVQCIMPSLQHKAGPGAGTPKMFVE